MNNIDTLDYLRQLGYNNHIEENRSTQRDISKSNFDRTLIGRVINKETFTNKSTSGNNSGLPNTFVSKWNVHAGGQNFRIDVNNSDITSIGQQVRVFIPSNNKQSVYAEVINPATSPDKVVYKKNDDNYNSYKSYGIDTKRNISESDITINSITQYWLLSDGTYLQRIYILTIINADTENEEITNIIHPDGKRENLEGFIIGKSSSSSSGKINNNTRHPVKLEYKDEDPDYTIPSTIVVKDNETFDTITETWIIDPNKEQQFNSEDEYGVGDIVIYNEKIYQCIENHTGEWDETHFTEIPAESTSVYGVGVKNKNADNEEVTRLIYPDFSEIELINFNGVSGLG